jgi:hypothetical protein
VGAETRVQSTEEKDALRQKKRSFRVSKSMRLTPSDLSPDQERQHRAAITIQTVALKRLVGKGIILKREAVIDRLKLESRLQRDMRLMLLCAIQFVLVIAVCLAESNAHARLGLLRTYKDVFSLDDSLADIKTLDSLQNYLRTVSERARLLQPRSDYYFRQPEGEIRVFEGVHAFTKPVILNLQDLKPRFDTPEWTLTAWVQHEAEGGGYIIRKPLGQTPETNSLSCWAWYMGWPQDKFEFGAHDYRGGSDAPGVQEQVLANGTTVDSGNTHFIALVVSFVCVSFPCRQIQNQYH